MAELVCGTADREAWLAARRRGITATDIAVIMGLVSWDSPFALYWRKKGVLPEVEQSDRMRLGSWLEGEIKSQWARATQGGCWPGEGLWRSSARPWQMATPDAIVRERIIPTNEKRIVAVLECKTSSTRDGWGDDGTGVVPAHVRAQVLWQMDTLDVGTGHVAVVFLPSGEFRSYTIGHDTGGPAHEPDLDVRCQACRDIVLMHGQATEFYQRLLNDDPPPVDGSPPTTDALRCLHAGVVKGKRVDVHPELAERWWLACDNVKRWEAEKTEAANLLRDEMGDAQYAGYNGSKLARREVFKNPGYTVAPFEVDRLVRVKPKETGNG